MAPKKYRVSSSSGSGGIPSREISEIGMVGRTPAMATSGASPLSNLDVVSPFASLATVPFASNKAPKQRRQGQVMTTQQAISAGIIAPHGRLPPLGGAMGVRLARMGALMEETRLATGSSAPVAPVALTTPTPTRRAGSLPSMANVPSVNPRAEPNLNRRAGSLPPLPEYKKGGKVKKTGMAKVHKGEVVIPKARVEAVEKAVKKAGLKSIKVASK